MNEALCVVAARRYNCAMLNGKLHLEQAKGSSVVDFYIVRAHYSLIEALLNEYFFVFFILNCKVYVLTNFTTRHYLPTNHIAVQRSNREASVARRLNLWTRALGNPGIECILVSGRETTLHCPIGPTSLIDLDFYLWILSPLDRPYFR